MPRWPTERSSVRREVERWEDTGECHFAMPVEDYSYSPCGAKSETAKPPFHVHEECFIML